MSHEAARIILDLVLRHGAEQDEMLSNIEGKCTADEFREYKQMIDKSMGAMLLDVINPIVKNIRT